MTKASSVPLPPWPVDTIDVPGARLAVRRAQPTRRDAEPALFVHGLGGSATNWTDLMGRLRDRVDGEAVDLPGFGFSPPPDDGDFSPEGHARVVVALLEQGNRGPVHLFGNSLGGAVATLVAARRPDLVRTLTLVSPAMPDLRPRRHTLPMALMWLPVFGEAAQRYLMGLPAERRMEGILELCFAEPSSVPERRRVEAIEEIRRRNGLPYASDAALASLRGLVCAYVTPGTRSPWSSARQITVPTLVLYGREDRLVGWRQSRRAARTYPGARVVVLPGCGHVAQMERPDLIARAWRSMRDSTWSSGRASAGSADHDSTWSSGRASAGSADHDSTWSSGRASAGSADHDPTWSPGRDSAGSSRRDTARRPAAEPASWAS